MNQNHTRGKDLLQRTYCTYCTHCRHHRGGAGVPAGAHHRPEPIGVIVELRAYLTTVGGQSHHRHIGDPGVVNPLQRMVQQGFTAHLNGGLGYRLPQARARARGEHNDRNVNIGHTKFIHHVMSVPDTADT